MEDTLQKIFSVIIAVVIMFILPVYVAYEKKDDLSYVLALKITTDFVENVNAKGYVSSDMYNDFISKLAITGNSYDIYMEHTAKKYNPVIYSYTDDLKTIRYKFDYYIYKDQYESGQITVTDGANAGTYNNLILAYDLSEERYTESQILDIIDSRNKNLTVNTTLAAYKTMSFEDLAAVSSIYTFNNSELNIYTMNIGDEFNVIIKNKNTTPATSIFNVVTFGVAGNNNTKVYVNYGGTIKAEVYRERKNDEDTTNYNPETDKSNTASLVNSYITEGLVLLLDGGYNSGTVHSNTTDTWMDLSGNGNNAVLSGFDFDDESGWRHNGLHFTGKEYVSLKQFEYENITIEAVVRFDNMIDIENPVQTVVSNINAGGYGLVMHGLNSMSIMKRGKAAFDIYCADENQNLITDPASVVSNAVLQANKIYVLSGSFGNIKLEEDVSGMFFDTTIQLLGVNGEYNGIDFTKEYMKPATGSYMIVGGTPLAGAGANTQLKGTIYSIRIYNRALSEDELKENYEIDKIKYGL